MLELWTKTLTLTISKYSAVIKKTVVKKSMTNTSCHRCKEKDSYDNKVLDFDELQYPLCQKCVKLCIDISWKFFLKHRVLSIRYPKPEQANTEEEFECYRYLEEILSYDESPYKPYGSVDVFGHGRWKIARFAVGIGMVLFVMFLISLIPVPKINNDIYKIVMILFIVILTLPLYPLLYIVYSRIVLLLNLFDLHRSLIKENKLYGSKNN